jgi:flagellar biogenesis protein FliO
MDAIQQTGAVAGVLTLLFVTLWWLKRRGFTGVPSLAGRAAGRRLECLERLALGPQHTLHLVRIGSGALLIASSPAGCAVMHTIAHPDLDAARAGAKEAGV